MLCKGKVPNSMKPIDEHHDRPASISSKEYVSDSDNGEEIREEIGSDNLVVIELNPAVSTVDPLVEGLLGRMEDNQYFERLDPNLLDEYHHCVADVEGNNPIDVMPPKRPRGRPKNTCPP